MNRQTIYTITVDGKPTGIAFTKASDAQAYVDKARGFGTNSDYETTLLYGSAEPEQPYEETLWYLARNNIEVLSALWNRLKHTVRINNNPFAPVAEQEFYYDLRFFISKVAYLSQDTDKLKEYRYAEPVTDKVSRLIERLVKEALA